MSQNKVEITQNDSIFKASLPKEEITSTRDTTNFKTICSTKKIAFTSLLILLIVSIFITSIYLLLTKNTNASFNLDELRSEKRRAPILDSQNTQQTLITGSRSLSSPANSVTGYERNVLLITNYFSKKKNGQDNVATDVLYKILNQMKKVNLTIMDAYDANLNYKGINYLKNFHLVVLDFVDAGYNLAPRCPYFVKALMQYIKEGGALFTNHDQFDDTHSRYVKPEAIEMLQLLGFKHQNSHGYYGSVAYFDKTAISNSFFVADHAMYGDSIPIASTHQTYSKYDEFCTTCKVIMKFTANGPNSHEYLVTNRPYKGKTLNIRAGHTHGFTEAEKKIFLSSILWLLYEV